MHSTDLAYCSPDQAKLEAINGRQLGGPDRVSSQWVAIIKHPTAEQWAAIIPADYMESVLPRILTAEERQTAQTNGFKTRAEMLAEGWDV
jgi:hypothetical protein